MLVEGEQNPGLRYRLLCYNNIRFKTNTTVSKNTFVKEKILKQDKKLLYIFSLEVHRSQTIWDVGTLKMEGRTMLGLEKI